MLEPNNSKWKSIHKQNSHENQIIPTGEACVNDIDRRTTLFKQEEHAQTN